MTGVLAHRGPDHEDYRILGTAGLGSRRLAIVDRSPAGTQPMCDEAGTLWIVCNGEIYNHVQLRGELEKAGFRFRSKSDTEVILYLYRLYGDACVDHLRGMFAFAIWDTAAQRLLLCRDRFGQKPLFYARHDGQFCFASELKSLRQNPHLPWEIDNAAIHRFITMDYIPAPGSVFRAVHKLPAAHQLVLERGQVTLRRYWRLDFHQRSDIPPLPELCRQVREQFEECVNMQLMGEVPVGVFLSGGIDSNAIAATVSRGGSTRLSTFSLGFAERAQDESRFARESARIFGSEHHELMLSPALDSLLPRIVDHFDEPFGDPSAVPTWCLSEMAGRHITVALSGEGGDEAFAGYPRYRKHQIARALWLFPKPVRQALARLMQRFLPASLAAGHPLRGVADLLGQSETSLEKLYGRWLFHNDTETADSLYSPEFRAQVSLDDPVQFLAGLFAESTASDPVNAMLDVDQQSYLSNGLLTKLDMAAMAHSVEGRSPFLDHVFAEFIAGLPGRYKLRNGTSKWVFRKALQGLVPPGVLTRGKRGFGLPLERWLHGPLRGLLHDTLLSQCARERGLVNPGAVESLIANGINRTPHHRYLAWNLLVLELWLRSSGSASAGLRFDRA